ncbi:beta-N-acetylhexosaminidase [Rubritalea spongiae]|uniref:beta-N-acetylhexosaminidase n=1 Tax=Rubritalea spongiae TaxID=430797 RepID=A0ABW5E2X3_9BACT
MKYFLSALILMVAPILADSLPIIPKPVQVERNEGSYQLQENLAIRYQSELKREAEILAHGIENTTGIKAKLVDSKLRIALQRPIELKLLAHGDTQEAYNLQVKPSGIRITGSDSAGAFYGIQSLLQLIPLDGTKTIPACSIHDSPRFRWRGMHLDVAHHMFPAKDIKKWIDWLAFHKINTFHWHLTDDQGWRIEIKQFPKLTEVGAYRNSTPPYLDRWGSDNTRYGGFYTQKEIKEIVAYAADRHITVIPEISMPSHVAAALAAYPELGNKDIKDYSPKVHTVWSDSHDGLSPTEPTFQWIDKLIGEVCTLFPSPYIHIGGYDSPITQWKKSKQAQSVIKREGLQNEKELQTYFFNRVSEILSKHQRKLIGGDALTDGQIPANATIMLSRNSTQASNTLEMGHDLILASSAHTNFDHYQNDPAIELSKGSSYECVGGYRPLASVYNFNPIPEPFRGSEKTKHILGCQAQLWTQYMKTWDKVEYQTFPRIAAFSEVVWSPQTTRNYPDFLKRLKPTLARYAKSGINYFDPFNPGTLKTRKGATVETNLPYHRDIPEYAIIGNNRFAFQSKRPAKKGDHFTVHLKQTTKGPITVTTGGKGRKSGSALASGTLEVSSDSQNWTQIAQFENGKATGEAPDGTKHIKITVTADQKKWLTIEEIHFQ